jgi:hypothetical protein
MREIIKEKVQDCLREYSEEILGVCGISAYVTAVLNLSPLTLRSLSPAAMREH